MGKGPTLEQLRTELKRAFREESARAVARELGGVSASGLLKFVKNPQSTIYLKTYRKLSSWYQRRGARGLAAPEAQDVAPSVEILTREIHRDLGPEEARRVRTEIAGMLGRVFADRQGVDAAVDAALGDTR